MLKDKITKFVDLPEVHGNRIQLASFIIKFLNFYRLWVPGDFTRRRILQGYAVYLLCNTIVICDIWRMYIYIRDANKFRFDDISDDILIIAGSPGAILVFTNVFNKQKQFHQLLTSLGDFTVYEKPQGIELLEATYEVLCKFCLLAIVAPMPVLLIFLEMDDCLDVNDHKCGLIFPGYFPGCMTPRSRKLCAVLQLLSGYSVSYISFLCYWFMLQFSEYIVCYLKHLHRMIEIIPLLQRGQERNKQVIKVIKYHHHILEMYNDYFELVKSGFLIHIFITPVVLGLLAYTVQTDFKIQNVCYGMLFVLALSLVCYTGQKLVEESVTIADVAYDSIPWDGDYRTGTSLMLLMLRSQRAMYTPAGSVTYCGNELFVSVMKTTYSYLTLMHSTNQK